MLFVAQRRILNWPLGIANNAFFIVLFASAGLYADSGLQFVYIALGIYGWYMWLRGGQRRTRLLVTRFTAPEWLWLAVAGFAIAAGLTWMLTRYTSSTVPVPDAVTTALSLMATYGQCKKKLESWYLWIAADLIYIPLYLYKGLALTSLLYLGFMILCVYGLVQWRLAYHRERDPVAITTADLAEQAR